MNQSFKSLLLAGFALLLMLPPIQSNAQWEFGFGMNGMAPVDRFKGSVYKPAVGMFTNLTTSSILPKATPTTLQFGLYFDYLDAGKKRFDVELEDPVGGEGQTTLGNYSTAQHFFVRYGYQVSSNALLFTDLIIGHRNFYSHTRTGLKKNDELYEDDYQRVHKNNTYRHGVGFGVRYGFGRSFGLEIRADYTRGNSATYFNLETIEETAAAISYENETWAHTDLFVGTFAVNWKLFRSSSSSNEMNSTQGSYYDDYPNSQTTPTYRRNNRRSTVNTRTTPVKKRTVKSKKTVEPKKKDDKINW